MFEGIRNWFGEIFRMNNKGVISTKDGKPFNFSLLNTSNSMYFELKSKDDILNMYFINPTLRAIIDKKAKIFARVNRQVLDKNDQPIENHILTTILKNPHPFYSSNEFFETYSKQLDLFNEVIIYVNSALPGIVDKNTTFLILPAQMVKVIAKKGIDIKTIQTKYDIIDHYELIINNKTITFQPLEILHITNTSMDFDNSGYLTPNPALFSAERPLNTILSCYEIRNSFNNRKGGFNILVNDSKTPDGFVQDLNDDDVKDLQNDLKKYSFSRNDYNTIITNAKLTNLNLSYPIKDMDLSDGIRQAKVELCDVLNVPLLFLNQLEGGTFNNAEIGNKKIYTDCIIPAWEFMESEINTFLYPSLGVRGDKFHFDYSFIEALQADKKSEGETNKIYTDNIISLNTNIKNRIITRDIAVNILVEMYKYNVDFADSLLIQEPKNDIENGTDTI